MAFNKNIENYNHDSSFFNDLKKLPVDLAKEVLKNENEKNKTGFLGKFFGSTDNTAIHIAGTIALILVVCGIIVCISSIFLKKDCEQYWKFAAPLITSCLGYIFGKIK